MKRCGIAFETLTDYHDGRLDEAAEARVREHLETDCRSCRENLAWLQNATGTLRAAAQVQVPEPVLTRAQALFRERFRPTLVSAPRPSWIARLQFDSRFNAPAFAAARGAKREGAQMVYSTEDHDIDIFQEPTEQGDWYLIGQVMPRTGDATIALTHVVLTGRDGSRLTFTPDSEEFHLPAVPQGIYEIALHLAEGNITLPDVGVGQAETSWTQKRCANN